MSLVSLWLCLMNQRCSCPPILPPKHTKMTAYSLHNIYITQWSAALATLSAIFTKAEAHAKGNGIDADVEYIDARIRDDMLALPSQVHLMTGVIKLPLSLLTGNSPEWEDDLKTFADIHARIKSAQDFVNGVKPDDIDGRDDEVLKSYVVFSRNSPSMIITKATKYLPSQAMNQ